MEFFIIYRQVTVQPPEHAACLRGQRQHQRQPQPRRRLRWRATEWPARLAVRLWWTSAAAVVLCAWRSTRTLPSSCTCPGRSADTFAIDVPLSRMHLVRSWAHASHRNAIIKADPRLTKPWKLFQILKPLCKVTEPAAAAPKTPLQALPRAKPRVRTATAATA